MVYQASADYARRKLQAYSIAGAASKHIKAIFGNENDVTKDGLQTSVIIRVNGRDQKHKSGAEERLEQLAIDLISNQESDDHFIIHLRNGQRISENEIYVKSTAVLRRKGKSVERDNAWQELEAFYGQLVTSGVVAQWKQFLSFFASQLD